VTISCCRSIKFSAAKEARLAKNALKKVKIARKRPIHMPPYLVGRLEAYDQTLSQARIVSP
jgi:hypothetical protein